LGASRIVALSAVWSMLAICAPGYSARERKHDWLVVYNGRTYAGLPLGEHGPRRDPETFAGHVRHLVRKLDIEGCAREHMPEIFD